MLWGESYRWVFTLVISILGVIAWVMIPGKRDIEAGKTARYLKRGTWVVFILALLILVAAGLLGYEWYKERSARSLWVLGNLALFSLFGISLMVGNALTMRNLKKGAAPAGGDAAEPVEAEMVDVESVPDEDSGPAGPLKEAPVKVPRVPSSSLAVPTEPPEPSSPLSPAEPGVPAPKPKKKKKKPAGPVDVSSLDPDAT